MKLAKFIQKSNEIHNNVYNYDKFEYVNNKTKGIVICKTHGEFMAAPNRHLLGQGCPECGKIKCRTNNHKFKYNTSSFIEKANLIHNNKYDYNKTDCQKSEDKVIIICPEHGEFIKRAEYHISNSNPQGCPKCKLKEISQKNASGQEHFLAIAKKIHGDRYDYSKAIYTRKDDYVTIICKEHGEFLQSPNKHHSGRGCPKCANTQRAITLSQNSNLKLLPTIKPIQTTKDIELINKFRLRHGNKYDYSYVKKEADYKPVIIICPIHGPFKQSYKNHLSGNSCFKCSSITTAPEKEIIDFLKTLSIEVMHKNREIISPLELDIYVPKLKLAIEYCGLYWHSDRTKDKNYHLNKLKLCQEKGIKLITIFEDEWINKKDIVKSIIKYKVNGIFNTIYARKCNIAIIDNKVGRDFIEQNHLQGKDNGSIYLGAFYNDELISVISFVKPTMIYGKNHKHHWEISRFVTKLECQVIGVFSKFLKYFSKEHKNEILKTYSDLRWSNENNVYSKNGFKLDRVSSPSYWYYLNRGKAIRYHRSTFMKHKLQNKLKNFDPNITANQNMINNGYFRIWDCGNAVFTKVL